jgi:hypothetical protein
MGGRRKVPLAVTLDGRQVASETTCIWAGPYVLTIATALPGHGLALEVHSTFVGHDGVPTCVTHLTLGPVEHDPTIAHVEHPNANLDPMLRARECAYEHVQIVLKTLKQLGHEVTIAVPDNAFEELERVEPR